MDLCGRPRSFNQHDDEPNDADLDLDRVVAILRLGTDDEAETNAAPLPPRSASVDEAAKSTSGDPAAASSGGWAGLHQWVRNQSTGSAHGRAGSALGRSSTFGDDGHRQADTPGTGARAIGATTPSEQIAGGPDGPSAANTGTWSNAYVSMATPPRPAGQQVASLRDFAAAPLPVSATRSDGISPQAREPSQASQYVAYNRGGSTWSTERSVPSGGGLLYSLNSPTRPSPTKQGSDEQQSSGRIEGSGSSGSFPAPLTRPSPQAAHARGGGGAGAGLSSDATPFTPQRFSGYASAHESPSTAEWSPGGTYGGAYGSSSPHRAVDPIALQPLTPPANWTNPAHGATPQQAHGHGHAMHSGQIPMEQLKVNAVGAAKDQLGCRLLQRVLDMPWESPDVQDVFERLYPALPELMADAYGNFLVQKLLDVAPDATRLDMTRLVAPQLAHVATTPHGTFAAQKLVDSLRSAEERIAVCEGLSRSIVTLCTDHNGAHVVQKVVAAVGPTDRGVLFEGIAEHITAVANNRYGTCIVQRCLERSVASPPQFNQLAEAIIRDATALITDPFGNYVVQRLIDQCAVRSPAADAIVRRLTETANTPVEGRPDRTVLGAIVTSQYSSKAVEKAVQRASPLVAAEFAGALGRCGGVAVAIADQFGNYIVQTTLALATTAFTNVTLPDAVPSARPVPPPAPQPSLPAKASARDLGGLTVTAGDEDVPLTADGGAASLSSLAMPASPTELSPHDERIVAPFRDFVSAVEAAIGAVRGLGFQKKMEHKLDQALRLIRASADARRGGSAGHHHGAHHRGGNALPPGTTIARKTPAEQSTPNRPRQGSGRGLSPQTQRGGYGSRERSRGTPVQQPQPHGTPNGRKGSGRATPGTPPEPSLRRRPPGMGNSPTPPTA